MLQYVAIACIFEALGLDVLDASLAIHLYEVCPPQVDTTE